MNILKNLPSFCKEKEIFEYNCGDNSYMRLIKDASYFEYESYCNTLEQKGYNLIAHFDIDKNYGKTFLNGNMLLQCNFREYEKSICIIADSNTNLPLLKMPENTVNCKTELIQFETDHSLIDCGMCYIIRLCDGSFFIIDSSHFYSVNDEIRLHSLLRSKTPENEKIVIAGWFFTHGHDDHVTKAVDYIKYMCNDTVIEGLYFNFPSLDCKDSCHWSECTKNMQKLLSDCAENSNYPVYNIHSLQRFYIRNLQIDVLCTHEDVYPKSMENYNDTSTVIMVTTDGNKILFPGDAGKEESDILTNSFSNNTLKCDILQLSHHGHFGCSSKFYEMCNAPLLLIPNTEIKFAEATEKNIPNTVALRLSKEHYISAMGTVEIPLPYKQGNVKVYNDETTENFQGIYNLWGYAYSDEFKQKHQEEFLKRKNRQN